MLFRLQLVAMAALVLPVACQRQDLTRVQGYVEGEFVNVASPLGGRLEKLPVARGTRVKNGDLLFALEQTSELAARDQAVFLVNQARAALVLSEKEWVRQSELLATSVAAQRDADQARSQRDQDLHHVSQLQAALDSAQWNLDQKQQSATRDGLVFDTPFHEGDWVPAGNPVVVMLPPENVKVRAFVSQKIVGNITRDTLATIHVDGRPPQTFEARVSFVSPRAEYTPPVIYSQDMREKLVFLIELSVEPEVAKKLHPGQPVDVHFQLKK